MQSGLWVQWAVLRGLPRAYLSIQARRGELLSQLVLALQRGDDPYPLIEPIRARGRLIRTPAAWVTADHELCRAVLRDDRFGVSVPDNLGLPRPIEWLIRRTDPQLPNPAEAPSMLKVDPPAHTRYRRIVVKAFTPRSIEGIRAQVTEVANELLNDIELTPQCDLMQAFADRLPAITVPAIMGWPDTLQPVLLDSGERGTALLDVGVPWKTFRRTMQSLKDGDEAFADYLDQLRSTPGDDIFSRAVHSGEFSRRELATTAVLMITAGVQTTANLIGNALVLLLRHPSQLELVRANPELWPDVIEEVLRFDSPVVMTARVANCDLALAGHEIAAGQTVTLLLAGANRDPGVFTDPGRFDITRANAKEHLSFSSGVHACLGAYLARMESSIALSTLFGRFPTLQMTGTPTIRGHAMLRGVQHLPANAGPRVAASTPA